MIMQVLLFDVMCIMSLFDLVLIISVVLDDYHDFAVGFQSTLPPNDICPPSVTPGKLTLPFYSL